MSLVVKPIEATTVSFEQYYNFIQDAYAERVEQGLHFFCTTLTIDELKMDIEKTGAHTYLGFLDNNPGEIAASVSVAYRYDKEGKYAWFHLVATNNKIKGRGVGTEMLQTMIDMARDNGCHYISLSTATKATSAVKFYEKNGFFKTSYYQLLSWGGYRAYNFRYQIIHPSKWDCRAYRWMVYVLKTPKQVFKTLIKPIYQSYKKIGKWKSEKK